MIQILNVTKTYRGKSGDVNALKQVSLTVEKGDIFGVIGFSGAGKSTLLRMVNLLEAPDRGDVVIDGETITSLKGKELRAIRKEIGMVFQQFNLLSSKTVYQNVAAPLILAGIKKKEIQKRVPQLLEFVGLADRSDTYVSKLSGGQKQRVGIARALALNPKILLCDEATSALDPKTTQSILDLLKRINQELGVTILLITHEMNVIKEICNKVAVMETGDIVEQGEVIQVFGNPQKEITKNFVKTVINDRLPDSIQEYLRSSHTAGKIVKLKFLGDNSKNALISEINKKFQVETAILFASVNELQGQILGILIIHIVGTREEIEKVREYIKESGVEEEEVLLQ